MAFNIDLFKAALKLGGARPSLFQVNITNPVNGVADIQVPFMVKAAQIPASSLQIVPIRYFGREIKLAGNRTYAEWSVVVINDEDFAIRNALEQWSNAINSPKGNLRALTSASPILYKSDARVTQFSKTGAPLRVYSMRGIWPSDVGPIELNWDNGEQIEEYQVTFQVDYFEVTGGLTGTAGQ